MPNSRDQLLACIPRLRRYARALFGERASADDLVQDTVERGWARLASWEGGSDMRAWLFSIMHNLRIDQVRRPSVPTETLNEETSMATALGSPSSGLELRDMETALRALPDEQREILLLVALEEIGWLLHGQQTCEIQYAQGDASRARPALYAAGLAHQAAIAHVVFSPDIKRPVEIGADQEEQLVAWLSKRLGTAIRPPRLGHGRVRPTGETVMKLINRPLRCRRLATLAVAGMMGASTFGLPMPHHHGQPAAATEPVFVASTAKPFAALMNDAMAVMDEGMKRAPMNGVSEHDFVTMMIPHHRGAVDMAKALLLTTKAPELRNVALGIITEQQNEIKIMQAWLRRY